MATIQAPLGEVTLTGNGTDRLKVDYSTVTEDIFGTQSSLTDEFFNTINFSGFASFDITGGSGNDTLYGGDSADRLVGGGGDTLWSGLGADSIDGGAGLADLWVADYSSLGVDVSLTLNSTGVSGGSGLAATISATSASIKNIEAITLTTGAGNDAIDTSAVVGNDWLSTGEGDDFISSGLGLDTIYAGGGDDTIRTGLGFSTVDAGSGFDTPVEDYSTIAVDIKMTSAVYPYSGPYYSTPYDYSGHIQAGVLASTSVDFSGVEAFNITGGSGNDTLYGGGNNDRLVGGAGNDILYGGGGFDSIDGGAGTDTWQVDYAEINDNVTISLASLVETAPLGVTVTGIEQLIVNTNLGDDVITTKAGAFNDVINTGSGDDTITSGRGVDTIDGGTGKDTLVMNWAAVTTNISAVTTTPNYPYDGSNGYYGSFTSASGDSLTFNNIEVFNLTGGSGNDLLNGGIYDDSLNGGSGNDILTSGAGADKLAGGTGDDLLDSGTGKDTVDGGAGNDIWQADVSAIVAGLNVTAATSQTTAQGTASGQSIRNIEGFSLHNGMGNDNLNSQGYALNDLVYANGGNDVVSLGLGFDTATGDAGVDTLTVDYSSLTSDISTTAVGVYSANLGWVSGFIMTDQLHTASITYSGFEKYNLTGGSGNDTLMGGSDVDTLIGNAGNDVLNSGIGRDIIDGGAGNDTWIGDESAATTVIKLTLAATGTSWLTSTTASKVTSNVVRLDGIEAVGVSTGSKNDIIDTSAVHGNDSVSTGAGDDIVRLGDGNDYANGGDGNDTLVVNFSSSTTIIRSVYGSSYYDAAKLNVINYSSFELLDVTGGSANDRLMGYYGDDKINGGAGNDIINGDSGNDTLTGGAGNDIFDYSYYWAAGVDTITDASVGDSIRVNYYNFTGSSVVLGDGTSLPGYQVQLSVDTVNNLSTLHIGGNALQINLTGIYSVDSFTLDGRYIKFTQGSTDLGTLGNDTLVGTIGADELSGGAGNDILMGKEGNDLLDGGADNDTVIGDAGNDTISGGTGDDLLTGGLGADDLTGGTGADKFIFTSIFDSTPGTPYHDVINDFSVAELDKIDLSAIDANSAAAGNQAFNFIKTDFTGTAGQVRFDASTGLVLADVNGDSLVDIEIQVLGAPVIVASSFVL